MADQEGRVSGMQGEYMTKVELSSPRATLLPDAAAACRLFVVAMLASTVVHLLVFHPYYFGDELFNFAMADSTGQDFLATFAKLNSYKPRILFNGWWALITTAQLPRIVPMLISTFFLAATLTAACLLAVRMLDQPHSTLVAGLKKSEPHSPP